LQMGKLTNRTTPHQPAYSMQGDVRASQWRSEIQALNHPAKHDDVTGLSIIAGITVLKNVGALEREAPVFVACRLDTGEGNRIVKELHLIHLTLAAGALNGELANTGAFEPQPENAAQTDGDDDFKPRHDENGYACFLKGQRLKGTAPAKADAYIVLSSR
ncbi:MAG: hypothetical protein WEK74_02750, partial [Hydrogenophaga sp.]